MPEAAKKAVSKTKVLQQVGFVPHAGQLDIINSDARFRIAACGRRFGKSEVGGHELLPAAFLSYYRRGELEAAGKRMEYWIVGPEYSDAEKEFRVFYNRCKQLGLPFDRPGTYNDPLGGNMHVSLWGGRFQVHAKSAKHPETLVGEGLHGVVLSEAAKIKERVWTKFIRPTLNDFGGWAYMGSTPEGRNWFYDMWVRGQDPLQGSWMSWRKPSWDNPYVYPGKTTDAAIAAVRDLMDKRLPVRDSFINSIGINREIVELINDLPETVFNQEIAADFTEFVGRVFKDFDEEVHVDNLTYQPGWPTYAAVDYGFTNPNVWLLIQEDPFGEQINVLGEVYERGLSPNEFAAEIKRRGLAPEGMVAFYPDPASPGDTKILSDKLRVKARGGTGGALSLRLDAIRKALKPMHPHLPDSRPRLVFDRSCSKSIADMSAYRYPEAKTEMQQERNSPEAPMKKDDHAPEALGRYFAGRFGAGSVRNRRARQTEARIER